MSIVALALTPIFLLIVIGYVIRWRAWLPDSFWAPAETLTYYVFFPALLLNSIAKVQLTDLDLPPMAATLLAGVALVGVLTFALRRPLKLDGPAFSSVFQGSIRPNTYVGIAAAAGLYGPPGVTLVAICVAIVIPTVNALGVIILARYGNGNTGGIGQTIGQIVRNPLIIACLSGAAINISGVELPQIATNLLDILGRAALPLGLLAVGAGLNLGTVKSAGSSVIATTFLKLILSPALTFGVGYALGLNTMILGVCVIYAALPVSASSYVLVRQMGGDARLMAAIITFSTLAAVVVIPIVAMLVA